MSKQDRQGVRTPADIERKYDLARLNEVGRGGGAFSDEQLNTFRQEVQQYMSTTNGLIDGKANKSGWTPDKFLGTDESGNIVEKDAPASEGGDDYTLTDEDVAMIVEAVLDALPDGDEVSY